MYLTQHIYSPAFRLPCLGSFPCAMVSASEVNRKFEAFVQSEEITNQKVFDRLDAIEAAMTTLKDSIIAELSDLILGKGKDAISEGGSTSMTNPPLHRAPIVTTVVEQLRVHEDRSAMEDIIKESKADKHESDNEDQEFVHFEYPVMHQVFSKDAKCINSISQNIFKSKVCPRFLLISCLFSKVVLMTWTLTLNGWFLGLSFFTNSQLEVEFS